MLIVKPVIVVRRPLMLSKTNICEASWPILIKFQMKHPLDGEKNNTFLGAGQEQTMVAIAKVFLRSTVFIFHRIFIRLKDNEGRHKKSEKYLATSNHYVRRNDHFGHHGNEFVPRLFIYTWHMDRTSHCQTRTIRYIGYLNVINDHINKKQK